MKRILLVTALVGAVALIPLAAQAQRGGGGHGGAAVSHAGSGMARGSVGMRGATSRFAGQRAFPNSRFVFNNRFNNRFRFRNRFSFNSCFNRFGSFGGFGCSNAFLYGGYPYLWGSDFDNYFGQQQQQQQPVVEDNGNDRELAFEMQALRDEMQATREEQQLREERNNPPAKPSADQDDGNATLVFRDGRQLSVRNYAVADHTIWVLGPDKARKVQVSELDIPATEQINAKNGVEFHLPH